MSSNRGNMSASSREYRRGYMDAVDRLQDGEFRSELETEWAGSHTGDDYDKGFYDALQEWKQCGNCAGKHKD